jgi:N-acetylmuramoyl-L-alanine amidase
MKRKLNAIVIHCAATPNGKDINVAAIDAMHKARGFKRDSQAVRSLNPDLKHIGYHYVIEVDGTIRTGRGIEEVGAHVQGSNSKSIGICLIGTDKFTDAQWTALRTLVIGLAAEISGRDIMHVDSALAAYKDMGISIKGHRDYSPDLNGDGQITRNEWIKICPGFEVASWIKGGMVAVPEATL